MERCMTDEVIVAIVASITEVEVNLAEHEVLARSLLLNGWFG